MPKSKGLVSINTKNVERVLFNAVKYSYGFMEGAEKGKKFFLDDLGKNVIALLGRYIDSEAKANKQALHHVYEWYKIGSPDARLFDLKYTVSNIGLSISSTFKQSTTKSADATAVFKQKAKIMESGISVTIKPKKARFLMFDYDGETIFTEGPVTVTNPGGDQVAGSFEKTFNEFMTYFSQSFLKASGIFRYLEKPDIYETYFLEGTKRGKNAGVKAGFKYIVNATITPEY